MAECFSNQKYNKPVVLVPNSVGTRKTKQDTYEDQSTQIHCITTCFDEKQIFKEKILKAVVQRKTHYLQRSNNQICSQTLHRYGEGQKLMELHVKNGGGNSFSLRNNISSDNTLENEEYISKK